MRSTYSRYQWIAPFYDVLDLLFEYSRYRRLEPSLLAGLSALYRMLLSEVGDRSAASQSICTPQAAHPRLSETARQITYSIRGNGSQPREPSCVIPTRSWSN